MFLETSHQPFGAGKITNLPKFTIFYNTLEVGEHHILLGAAHVDRGKKDYNSLQILEMVG